jgi:type I restriction enzyme S subunit
VVNNNPDDPEGLVPRDYGTYQFFAKDDLVFKLIDLENLRTSRVGLVHQDGIMSSAYVRLVSKHNGAQRFFFHQYFDLYQRGVFNQLGAGVRSTLGPSDLLNIEILAPDVPEQSAIVRFLDHADRCIRRYIRAKRKLIAHLSEQKQAITHRPVTRGLDPNVPLKPSGLEWLRAVPEHWKVVRNGQLFVQRNQTGFADLPILEVSLKTGVRVRDFENPDRKQVMADRNKYKRAARGDIAYNMMRMWQGAVGVAPVEGLVSPAYVVARPLEGIEPRYFSNLFRTTAYMSEIDKYSRGIVKDRNRLYWEDFKQMSSCCPPPEEQVLIADAIEKDTRIVSDGMDRVQREMDLIQEYRTRLVADVVTGKFDVREAAEQLQDVTAEPELLDELETLAEADEQIEGADPDAPAEEAQA